MKEELDILLVARPGRAEKIYNELVNSGYRFLFITFKLFPKWLKKLVNSPKMNVIGERTKSSLLFSVYDYMKFQPHWKWLGVIKERPCFEFFLKWQLRNKKAKLIHYWPNYCYRLIAKYKKEHPGVKTYADVYLPCEKYLVDEIVPSLESFGVGIDLSYIRKRAVLLDDIMKYEDNFICQSEYVANSYKKYYPDKNYFIISSGVSISPSYKRKQYAESEHNEWSFVYCGKVSIEKGCDLLLEWFSAHSLYHIHLFGSFEESEKQFFIKYKDNNIHFHGSVSKKTLLEEFPKYDIGIHLSRYDSWSNAVCEIMGAGLPVIVSDQTGNYELVRDYDLGEICQLNMDNISKSIKALTHPERYNKVIDNLDRYIVSKPKSYSERIIEFYRKQLESL